MKNPMKSALSNKFGKAWPVLPLAAVLLLGAGILPPAAGRAEAAGAATAAAVSGAPASTADPALHLTAKNLSVTWQGKNLSIPGAVSGIGDTYIGLSSLSSTMGWQIYWQASDRSVHLSGRGRTISFSLNSARQWSTEYVVNGQSTYGQPAILMKGHTYVPLRYIFEQMGMVVSYDAKTHGITLAAIQENPITWTTKTLTEQQAGTDKQPAYTVKIQYPQLAAAAHAQASASGSADPGSIQPAVLQSVNALLAQKAQALLTQGKTAFRQASDGALLYSDTPPFQFDAQYSIAYNQQGKLSLYYDVYTYTGGANGWDQRQAYTFDLASGHTLSMQEAVGGNPNYLAIVNGVLKQEMAKADYPLFGPFKPIGADQGFYLRGDALMIFYDQDTIAPHAAGVPQFSIPLSKFR